MTYSEKVLLYNNIIKEIAKKVKNLVNESDQYKDMDDIDVMIVELGDFIKMMQNKYKKRNKKYGQDEIARLITKSLVLMFEN